VRSFPVEIVETIYFWLDKPGDVSYSVRLECWASCRLKVETNRAVRAKEHPGRTCVPKEEGEDPSLYHPQGFLPAGRDADGRKVRGHNGDAAEAEKCRNRAVKLLKSNDGSLGLAGRLVPIAPIEGVFVRAPGHSFAGGVPKRRAEFRSFIFAAVSGDKERLFTK
jgi:hypothetical protein